MKSSYQVAVASLVLILMSAVTAPAFAARTSGGAHTHSQTYHDHAPRVHVHGTHTRGA